MSWIKDEINLQNAQSQKKEKMRIQSIEVWNSLLQVIKRDVGIINKDHLNLLNGLPITCESNEWGHLKISKQAFPSYKIELLLDSNNQTIAIKTRRSESIRRRGTIKTTTCRLDLDLKGNGIIYSDSTTITLQELSQVTLAPVLRS